MFQRRSPWHRQPKPPSSRLSSKRRVPPQGHGQTAGRAAGARPQESGLRRDRRVARQIACVQTAQSSSAERRAWRQPGGDRHGSGIVASTACQLSGAPARPSSSWTSGGGWYEARITTDAFRARKGGQFGDPQIKIGSQPTVQAAPLLRQSDGEAPGCCSRADPKNVEAS